MQNTILYILTVLIWGTTCFVIKFQLGIVAPLLSIAYRFLIAACLVLAFCAWREGLRRPAFTLRQHVFIFLQGFFLFFLDYWLLYKASAHLISGLAALAYSTLVLMNIFNQWIFFGLPVRRNVLQGSLLGVAGVAVVFWPEIKAFSFSDATVFNLVLCLLSTYCASLGNIISLRNSRDGMPILKTNAYGMVWGALCALAAAALTGIHFNFDSSPSYVGALLYLGVLGSAAAFIMYLTLLKRIGADRAGYTAVLFPVVGLVLSTLYEHYTWTAAGLTGLLLVTAGNVLALSGSKS